jgi:glutathione S-transferase
MLEIDGKHTLVQSGAIMRYLGKLASLYPNDPVQAAKVDAIMDQETDAFTGVTVLTYASRFGLEQTPEEMEKTFENISEEILPGHLKNVEKLLIASTTGWLASTDDPSPADFMWWVKLSTIAERKEIKLNLEPFPKIQAFMAKFESLEAIQEYYAEKEDELVTGVEGKM